jgi:NitT/TauT family transport system ATP-binding protein
MDKSAPLIQIRNLSHYKGRLPERDRIFGPISVDLAEGEFVSILGPAFAGKTALLKMIAGIEPVVEGEIIRTIPKREQKTRLGIVLHDPALLPWRTVLRNIVLPSEIKGSNFSDSCTRARRLLAWFGLSQLENRRTEGLLNFETRAVAVCRALVESPDMLLLDDPFGALEPLVREKMLDAFQRLWMENRTTTVLCTTDIQQAVLLSDRIAVLCASPARLLEVIDVEIDRPRRLNKASSPQIDECCSRIRTLFRAQGILP